MSKHTKKKQRNLYIVGADAPFQFTEAYKSLRTNLEFLSASGNCKTILITSSVSEEGKSNVAINLAITLAASGTIPPNPTELLAAPATEKIFKALQNAFDYVIVDTPPVTVVTDAAVLCRVADGVLLVVRPGVTTIQGAQLSKKNLEAVDAHILGVIMNGYNAKKTGRRDGYSYAYSYSYYDSKQESNE